MSGQSWLGWFGLGAALALSAACSSEGERARELSETRYYEDVAPILNRSCVGCHRDGGIAPFPLTDYESAEAFAGQIHAATSARRMPPMPVDNSGACNTYSNARWLSDEEIATIARWAEAGATEGDPAKAPALPPPLEELDGPDATLDLGVEYLPSEANGHDDYRCFVVPAPVDEQQFLTAYQVFPGDPRVVHHLIVFQPTSREAVAAAHDLDLAETGPGYTCFGGPGIDASMLAAWAPGGAMISLPEGTGVPIAAGRELVLQVHYNLEHGAFPDRTRVGLRFATEPVITAEYLAMANTEMRLPPGRELVTSRANADFEQASLKVHGAMPHMHTLGRTLRVDAEVDGESRCLVDVDRWDFHWQNAWWYEAPLELEDLSSVSIECGFDTRTRTEIVTWGERTSDEMCLSYFYVTSSDEPDPVLSCSNRDNPLFGSCLDTILEGCYEPDRSGTCEAEGGIVSWSDGSRFVNAVEGGGFFGPSDGEPCVGLTIEPGHALLTRDAAVLDYRSDDDGVSVVCPDGSRVEASSFELREFAVCRGLNCPD
jgi:hypothetical protein